MAAGTSSVPPVTAASPDTPSSHIASSQIDHFLNRWGWALGVILSLGVSSLIAEAAGARITDFPVAIFLLLFFASWMCLLWFMFVPIEGAVSTATSCDGRSESILQVVEGAREQLLREILDTIKGLPALDDETLENLDDLIQCAGVARSISEGVGYARAMRRPVVLLLLALPPIGWLLALVVGDLPTSAAPDFWAVAAPAAIAYLIAVAIASRNGVRVYDWCERIDALSGKNEVRVLRQIKDWGSEE